MLNIGNISTTISIITKLYHKLRFDHIDNKNDITHLKLNHVLSDLSSIEKYHYIIKANLKSVDDKINNMDYNFNYIDNKLATIDQKLDLIIKKLNLSQ